MGSLLIHATILAALGVWAPAFSSPHDASTLLVTEFSLESAPEEADFTSPAHILAPPAPTISSSRGALGGDLPAAVLDLTAAALPELTPANPPASHRDAVWRLTAGELGRGLGSAADSGTGHGDGAEFFGVRASGSRFVYVVDCSTSMRGKRWGEATKELFRSLESLGPRQEFFVISFAEEAYPLPPPRGEPSSFKLLTATSENLKRVRGWLRSLDYGYDTRPKTAIQLALQLQPDAVFLLSDGELHDNTLWYLRATNSRASTPIPIHTIGLQSAAAQQTLRVIAEDSGGSFRFLSLRRDDDSASAEDPVSRSASY